MRSPRFLVPVGALVALVTAHCSSSSNGGSDPIPMSAYMGAGGSGAIANGGGAGTYAGSSSTGGSDSTAGGSGGAAYDVTVRSVAPIDTDPSIDQFLEPHGVLVRDPLSSAKLLFVHLGRSGGLPLESTKYLTQAALAGYRVIDLRYPNEVSIATACDADPDAACSEKVHAEIFDGVDHSSKVVVSPANSVRNRLLKLLAHLDAKYSNEGWGTFVANGALDLSHAAVSGHSLGGGQVAYIAKQVLAERVILFSAPVDGSDAAPAVWLSTPGATPPTALYGFVHANDPSHARVVAGWTALGIYMGDTPASVDGPPALYQSQSALITSMAPANGGDPHDSVVLDSMTPTLNDIPLYQEAWVHLIGPQ